MLSGGAAEVLCSTQGADEEVLGDELCEVSTWSANSKEKKDDGTYVSDEDDGGKQTRKREPVTHLLHQDTCGSQRRRRDVRSAVVIYNNADGDVNGGHDELTQR